MPKPGEARRSFLDTVSQNSSRWCRVGFRVLVIAPGELLMPEPLIFGIAFAEPPWLSVGADMAGMTPWQLRRVDQADMVTASPYIAGAMPAVSAIITEWITETTGKFVLGARVAIYADTSTSTVKQTVTAHLLFHGIGIKAMPGSDEL